ncbi:MAG: cyclic nucleotide-binding domain-containing protein [Elusimicrobia bacterium]|nr:cyclic nucleotide-binding domain-containing protein [Elusimicrobiota bacterium]
MKLNEIGIFKNLSNSVLKKISEIVEEVNIKKDTVIFEESAPADVFCLIAKGRVEVFKRLSGGTTKTLAVLSAGDYTGEMSLLEDKPRIASVKAIDDVTLFVIKKKKFSKLISGDLDMGMKLLSAIMSTTLNRLSVTNSHLTLLYDTGKVIASSKNLKQMTMAAFSNISKLFKQADSGMAAVYNEFTDELDVHSSINIKNPVDSIPKTDPFVSQISAQKELLITNEKIDFKNGFISGKSLIASAFHFEDKFLGFIWFAGNKQNAFSINDLIVLSSVASLISVSIKNISFISEDEARQRLEKMRGVQAF